MMEEEKGCAGTANSATEIQQQEIEERAQQDMLQQVDKEWTCRCDREIKAGLPLPGDIASSSNKIRVVHPQISQQMA